MQEQLFTTPAIHFNAQATLIPGEGWHLQIIERTAEDQWSGKDWTHYNQLSTPELFDVLSEHLLRTL